MDHSPKAENQLARIYKTEVQAVEGEVTTTGDQYFRLIAKAYVPKPKVPRTLSVSWKQEF